MNNDEIIAEALRICRSRFRRGRIIRNPLDAKDWIELELTGEKNEVFCVLFLTNKHAIISFNRIFYGTIDGASVHPRPIIQEALALNAAACIFAHNHPSGIQEPSNADKALTRRLTDALQLVDVRVLDHFVVGEGTVSFAEKGLL